VTVKANDHTGLAEPDVFYFGNLVGDSGFSPGRVDALDALALRVARRLGYATITNGLDFNRDGRVDVRDEWVLRMNAGGTLPPVETPSAPGTLPTARGATGLLDE
jgi:hypothetical protein